MHKDCIHLSMQLLRQRIKKDQRKDASLEIELQDILGNKVSASLSLFDSNIKELNTGDH